MNKRRRFKAKARRREREIARRWDRRRRWLESQGYQCIIIDRDLYQFAR